MVKQSIFILLFFIASSLSACAQQPQDSCNKYSEPSLGVTFCAPSKWTIAKKPGATYQEVFGEEKNGITPNINVVAAVYEGELAELATKMADEIVTNLYKEKRYLSIKLENKSEFAAKTMRGYRMAFVPEAKEGKLIVIQYLFAGKGNMKIVVTAFSEYADKDVMGKIFDDAMKTFEVSK